MGINYFTFNNKMSSDFNVWISGSGTFNTPIREVESISVPGRNGDLHIDNGKFANVPIVYPAFITDNFSANFDAMKAFLLSQRGYKKLSDTYQPDYYRRASFTGPIEPQMITLNRAGEFNISFDCDPRRFLKSGNRSVEIENNGTLKNSTLYTALPIIRAYGEGTLTVGDISVVITDDTAYVDLDCENQEAFEGSTNRNGDITLTDGQFPVLKPGTTTISYTGITSVEIIPHWWTI